MAYMLNPSSNMYIINNTPRYAERTRVFNVDGLCRLAAQSVDQSPDDVVDLTRLAEGGFNRTFLITMRGGLLSPPVTLDATKEVDVKARG